MLLFSNNKYTNNNPKVQKSAACPQNEFMLSGFTNIDFQLWEWDEHSNKKCIQTFNCRKFKLFKNLTLCSFFLFLKDDAIPMQLVTTFALCRKWGLIMNKGTIYIIFLTWYILDMMFSTIIGFPYKMAWPVTRYNPSQCSNGIGNKMNMWRIGTDIKRRRSLVKYIDFKGSGTHKQRPHVYF